jgi:hypothetical protein
MFDYDSIFTVRRNQSTNQAKGFGARHTASAKLADRAVCKHVSSDF